MKVTTEARENRQIAVTIEVEPEQFEAAMARAARKLAQKYKIPGFRPGKAPRAVIEHTLGKQALYEEVVDELGPQLYHDALDQQDIDPYGPGEMEDVQFEPLIFKMLVPLKPAVNLGDYRSLRLPFEAPVVDEHDVEHQLEHMRENQAIIEPAGDVPADDNMVATLDIESTVEGKEFIHQKGATITLSEPLDAGDDVIDFSNQIIGLKPGEDKTFNLIVPDTDSYGDFRGKNAEFKVHVVDLKKRELPALDDALAQTVGDFETLDALKAQIRSELAKNLEQQASAAYSDKVIDAIVAQAAIEFPPQLVESETDSMIERTEKRMKDQNLTMDQYLAALGKSKDEYRTELKPSAETRLKRGLALNQIIKEEGLTVSAEEVDQRINLMVASFGEQADAARKSFSSEKAREAILLDLLSQAGIERAMAIAKGQAPALPEAPVAEAALPAAEPAAPPAEAALPTAESAPAESA